jgi:hypothetical protein
MGLEHVEGTEGSAEAKRRARLVLETLTGERTIEEACAELSISPARFFVLREEALQGTVAALEPGRPGRPPAPVPDPEVEALRRENRELRRDVEVARLREEIAIAMPHLSRPPRGGEKGGDAPRRGGKRGTSDASGS